MRCEIAGYKVLSVRVNRESCTSHSFYIKEHSVKETNEQFPKRRTVFVLNVPPFFNETLLQQTFSVTGKVLSVKLHDKPSLQRATSRDKFFCERAVIGFKVAHVVYEEESALRAILKLEELTPELDLKTCNGISKWIDEYNCSIPDIREMKDSIDSFMQKYDEQVKREIEKAKTSNDPDDEGWTTVTKQGRKPGFERKESVTNKILANKALSQQKKELKNFYTFQIRESKMNHVITLRKKFEEDKKKIALLKQSRRFKPF